MTTENGSALYLITLFHADGKESERIVSAPTRSKALQFAAAVNKASAADVARVLGAGGKVEQASA